MNRRKKKKIGLPIRTLVAMFAVTLLLGGAIGGTMAWLSDDTAPLTNTFTESDIEITLTETDTKEDDDNDDNTNSYQMIPGHTITKDPKITVEAGSEPCWVFVEINENLGSWDGLEKNNQGAVYSFKDLLIYETASGWEPVAGTENVYAKKVESTTNAVEIQVLANDKILVSGDYVTKAMMEMIDGEDPDDNTIAASDETKPTLTFTAYAVQLYKNSDKSEFSAADAWEKAAALKTNP